jgi:enamine deaminase RidA (YjgF/YER057c/UK114 family)
MLVNQSYYLEFSNPPSLFDPVPYGFSHLVKTPPGSRLVFVAGQGGEENKDGYLAPDFRRQTSQALQNIQKALRAHGLDMRSVVKVTTLVVDYNNERLQILVEEFQRVWPENNFPVNTLIPVARLALDNMLIEIDAIAASSDEGDRFRSRSAL